MANKKTAVEWLIEVLWAPCQGIPSVIIEQAKQMEKEQMKDAFVACWESNIPNGIECKLDAEQYYNETYNVKDN